MRFDLGEKNRNIDLQQKVSTLVSLRSPRRLTCVDTFCKGIKLTFDREWNTGLILLMHSATALGFETRLNLH